jgi:adenylylsulfate kinase
MNQGMTIWLTGLPCSGKSTIGKKVVERIRSRGNPAQLLDGDEIRRDYWPELGFSHDHRVKNIERLGRLSKLMEDHGITAVVAAVSAYRDARRAVRARSSNFVEVYVNAPLAVCEERDVKGMYRRARAGELSHFTGVDDPYNVPENYEMECRTDVETAEESVAKVMALWQFTMGLYQALETMRPAHKARCQVCLDRVVILIDGHWTVCQACQT